MRTRLILGSPVRLSCFGRPTRAWSWFPVDGLVEAGLTGCVEPRCAGTVERVDDDRLGVGVGGRALLACDGKHSTLGGFVGLEPLVQPLVSDFEGTGQARNISGSVSLSQAGLRISTSSKSGASRD